jgi:hypothetical protein
LRAPSFEEDGWRLLDGEEHHRTAPKTFWIPDLELRKRLAVGDLAKLIFEITLNPERETAVERMWVIVRERIPGGYLGMLYNEPGAIAENDEFWFGTELPFEYRHIVDVSPPTKESPGLARAPAPVAWDRST